MPQPLRSVRGKLVVGFGLCLILIVGVGGLTVQAIRGQVADTSAIYKQNMAGIETLSGISHRVGLLRTEVESAMLSQSGASGMSVLAS